MTAWLRFGKFNLVGIAGAAVQLSLIALLTKSFDLRAGLAAAIAVEVAILHNFAWHERFTWRDRTADSSPLVRLLRFHAANGTVSLIGNAVLVDLFVERCGFPVVLSGLAAILICALVNFRLADRWVYRGTDE